MLDDLGYEFFESLLVTSTVLKLVGSEKTLELQRQVGANMQMKSSKSLIHLNPLILWTQ